MLLTQKEFIINAALDTSVQLTCIGLQMS